MPVRRFLVLLLLAIPAEMRAQKDDEPPDPKEMEVCRQEVLQTTMDLRACNGARFLKADRELNAVYRKLRDTLPADRFEQLRSVQLAWISLRDRACDFHGAEWEGGSLQILQEGECRISMTQERAEELRRTAQSPVLWGRTGDCATRSGAAEAMRCAEQDYRAADAELNQAYRGWRSVVESEGPPLTFEREDVPGARTRADLLRASQRAWLRFRDAQCAFESTASAGDSTQLVRTTCLATMARNLVQMQGTAEETEP